jgi:hypothetical protein
MRFTHYNPVAAGKWEVRVSEGAGRGMKVGEIRRKRGRRVSYVAWGEVLPQVFIAVMKRRVRPNTLTGVCHFVRDLNRASV